MRLRTSQSGFSAVEIVIVVAVVAVIGYLGYTFYNSYQDKKAAESAEVAETTEAPAITTANDLDKAAATMDQTELESGSNDDLSELDKELAEF